MINFTLLSFTIGSSFQKSPFLHFSSSTYSSFYIFKAINAQKFFTSFLFSQSLKSFSIIENSIFNQFITSLPILSFKSSEDETKISDQTFYSDTILSKNNKFHPTNYTEIINCKFMSIVDNEPPGSEGGLCIRSTKNTTIDSCYFYAITSQRTGSAIQFYEEYNRVNGTVINSMFKSITQSLYGEGFFYIAGGAISYGGIEVDEEYEFYYNSIFSSLTDNCYFSNINQVGYMFESAQFGIVTYITKKVASKNINFTDCGIIGFSQQTGFITHYMAELSYNSFSFINFFDCKYKDYGCFTSYLSDDIKNQVIFLSFINFINNSNVIDEFYASFNVIKRSFSNLTVLKLNNIQCNCKEAFIMIALEGFVDYEFINADITVSNSLFACPLSKIIRAPFFTLNHSSLLNCENCIFNYCEFNVDITNNIIDNFGYIQTSQFSASNTFSDIMTSASYYDLNQYMPTSLIVISVILCIMSFIVLIFIITFHRKTRNIDIEEFAQFDFNDNLDDNENINKENNIEMADDSDKRI